MKTPIRNAQRRHNDKYNMAIEYGLVVFGTSVAILMGINWLGDNWPW